MLGFRWQKLCTLEYRYSYKIFVICKTNILSCFLKYFNFSFISFIYFSFIIYNLYKYVRAILRCFILHLKHINITLPPRNGYWSHDHCSYSKIAPLHHGGSINLIYYKIVSLKIFNYTYIVHLKKMRYPYHWLDFIYFTCHK